MKDLKELQLTLVNEMGNIADVECTYNNGNLIKGFISEAVGGDPIKVTLCKHSHEKNESPYHRIDFTNLNSVTITWSNKETKTFDQ